MDREFAEAEDMLSRMFRTVHDIAPSTGALAEFPYYYGYQITVGPDGRPRGNLVMSSWQQKDL